MQVDFLVSLMQTANLFSSVRRSSDDTWRAYARQALEESTFEDIIQMVEGRTTQAQPNLGVEIPMKLERTSTSEQREDNEAPQLECNVNHPMRTHRQHCCKHTVEATMTMPPQQVVADKNA